MERLMVYLMSTKFTKEQMEEMEGMITAFFRNREMTLTPPIDIFALATELDFDVRAASFPDSLEGLVIVDETKKQLKPFGTNKVIGYSIRQKINGQKFTVAHELAHYIEAKANQHEGTVVIAARDHSPGYSYNEEEQRKDYIAAALLMPRDDMLRRFDKNSIPKNDPAFYDTLAQLYRVDIRVAQRRVEEVFGDE